VVQASIGSTVVSIGMDLGSGTGELDGALLVIDGLEARGRREPRFAAVGGNAGPDSAP